MTKIIADVQTTSPGSVSTLEQSKIKASIYQGKAVRKKPVMNFAKQKPINQAVTN